MIRPEDFPYITSLHVNDCYTYQDFDIPLHDYQPFSHLILTGKNGSGKSTILRLLNDYYVGLYTDLLLNDALSGQRTITEFLISIKEKDQSQIPLPKTPEEAEFIRIHRFHSDKAFEGSLGYLRKYERLIPHWSLDISNFWQNHKNQCVYSHFLAKRISKVDQVDVPTKESEFSDSLNKPNSTEFFTVKFKQYLVNQKIEQAFNQIDNQFDKIEQSNLFFKQLEVCFRRVFEDNSMQIEFVRNNYEIFLNLSDGQRLTFNELPDGISALLNILMDLSTRVNLIRKQVEDFNYNPCGIVLIDEPEIHLHLKLQEQVLPLLTNLFPNVQFIAATHSPAVIASVKQATVFDLTTRESIADEVVGRSYSDLMVTHFGLDNDYSNEADTIIKQVNDAVSQYVTDPVQLQLSLQKIYQEQSQYLSPTLRVELEFMIAQYEAKVAVHP
jgi:predicted ATP-binding protein involved in virulence